MVVVPAPGMDNAHQLAVGGPAGVVACFSRDRQPGPETVPPKEGLFSDQVKAFGRGGCRLPFPCAHRLISTRATAAVPVRPNPMRNTRMPKAQAQPGRLLLSPADHTLILIDHQPQMAFATRSIDPILLRNNAALVSKAARGFDVPTILTTVAAKTFSGPIFEEIRRVFPDAEIIDRTNMNTWEDPRITKVVNGIDRPRIVLAGLWTSVCIVGPALSALDQGFEVYVIADACGDVSDEAHALAMQRMLQAGARPMTALQYLLELQRDWARGGTYDHTITTSTAHGGGYGLGLIYAHSMFAGAEGH
jgi:nicotinamidase-related amidase